MKSTFLLLAITILFGINTNVNAQSKPFKGIVTYTINYEGDIDPATLAQQPKTQTVKIMNNKAKTEVASAGGNVYVIINGNDSSVTTLLDLSAMGMKYYMPVKKDAILAQLEEMPEIQYSDETKDICGYSCKKASYITKNEYGDKQITNVFYSEEIGDASTNFGGQFTGLKGFPMEYELNVESINTKITYTVTDVATKKVKIKDSDFMVTDDYEMLDEEKAKQLFGM